MINDKALAVLKAFEGCILKAYPDPATKAEPYTIGYGTTMFLDGTKVKLGDKITQVQADSILAHQLEKYESAVKKLVTADLTDNQLSALVVLSYNIGIGNLQKSTLLKMINKNPNDPNIKLYWLKWCYANGKVMKGLIRRRIEEWNVYITKAK